MDPLWLERLTCRRPWKLYWGYHERVRQILELARHSDIAVYRGPGAIRNLSMGLGS